jgi:hypothetical protein
VCTPLVVEETMRRSSPTDASVDVANDCEATVDPLRDVIVPPAPPASVPQVKVPFDQRSFSVDELHAVKLAPNNDASVSPPVDDALVKVRVDTVVVAKVEVPVTAKSPEVVALVVARLVTVPVVPVKVPMNPLVAVSPVAERLVVDAFVVVRVEIKVLVKVAPVAERLVVDAFVMVAVVKLGVSVKV